MNSVEPRTTEKTEEGPGRATKTKTSGTYKSCSSSFIREALVAACPRWQLLKRT
jgi:hypothetical protein